MDEAQRPATTAQNLVGLGAEQLAEFLVGIARSATVLNR